MSGLSPTDFGPDIDFDADVQNRMLTPDPQLDAQLHAMIDQFEAEALDDLPELSSTQPVPTSHRAQYAEGDEAADAAAPRTRSRTPSRSTPPPPPLPGADADADAGADAPQHPPDMDDYTPGNGPGVEFEPGQDEEGQDRDRARAVDLDEKRKRVRRRRRSRPRTVSEAKNDEVVEEQQLGAMRVYLSRLKGVMNSMSSDKYMDIPMECISTAIDEDEAPASVLLRKVVEGNITEMAADTQLKFGRFLNEAERRMYVIDHDIDGPEATSLAVQMSRSIDKGESFAGRSLSGDEAQMLTLSSGFMRELFYHMQHTISCIVKSFGIENWGEVHTLEDLHDVNPEGAQALHHALKAWSAMVILNFSTRTQNDTITPVIPLKIRESPGAGAGAGSGSGSSSSSRPSTRQKRSSSRSTPTPTPPSPLGSSDDVDV